MAYLYFDDSKHHQWGFAIGAFVIFDHDPREDIHRIMSAFELDPDKFEFKSSGIKQGNPLAQKLRSEFRDYIRSRGKISLCITDHDKNIGPTGLDLLTKSISHQWLKSGNHEVFFDEGLFTSTVAGHEIANAKNVPLSCTIHFEQDSKQVPGIQLADLAAHTCAMMLLDTLGKPKKFVDWPDSGYDDDVDIDLSFELWAYLRSSFLSIQTHKANVNFDPSIVDVAAHGLHIDPRINADLAAAAHRRFGEMYIGCAH